MNEDIRLKVGFLKHRKTQKLRRRLGDGGVLALMGLWDYAALNHSDGLLPFDAEDIGYAADWTGEGDLAGVLVEVGFLERVSGGYRLHDWARHQPWAAASGIRVARAKKAAAARWGDEEGVALWSAEQDRLKQEYQRARSGATIYAEEQEQEQEQEQEKGQSTPDADGNHKGMLQASDEHPGGNAQRASALARELAGEFYDLLVDGDGGSVLARRGRSAAVRSWSGDFDLLLRVDGQEAGVVREVMALVAGDRMPRGEGGYCHFQTVRSGKKLRARFDQLRAGAPGRVRSRTGAETLAWLKQLEAEG